jgi:sec-independent protein translocase protein TatB
MIGGLSMTELVIILGLALLLLGPDQLPSLAKSLGKGLKELRKATDDIKSQFEQEMASVDFNEAPKRILAPVPSPPADSADPAAARATARAAASAPDDPATARAAARRAALAAAAPAAVVDVSATEARAADTPAPAADRPVAAAEPVAVAPEPPAPTPAPEIPLRAAPEGTVARDEKA